MNPRKLLESASDQELTLVQMALPEEFARRGMNPGKTDPVLGTHSAPSTTSSDYGNFDVAAAYSKALRALSELGLTQVDDAPVPSLDAVSCRFTTETLAWLNERSQFGVHDELVVAPSMGQLSLQQFIKRFDRKQSSSTTIWQELWQPYTDVVHNNGAKGWQVAILLNDIRDPRNDKQPINRYGEPGLAYTGLTLKDQQKAMRRESRKLAKQGLPILEANLSQLVMINAQRRISGQPQLDERTFTRLIHYPTQKIDNFEWVPAMNWLRGRLRLFGSEANLGWSRFGVRRVLVLEELSSK